MDMEHYCIFIESRYKVPNNWFFDWGVQFVVIAIPIYLIFNKLGLFDNNSKTKK